MTKKLVLVSVVYRGRTLSVFFLTSDGKTIDPGLINSMLGIVGVDQGGVTYSIG